MNEMTQKMVQIGYILRSSIVDFFFATIAC